MGLDDVEELLGAGTLVRLCQQGPGQQLRPGRVQLPQQISFQANLGCALVMHVETMSVSLFADQLGQYSWRPEAEVAEEVLGTGQTRQKKTR